MKMIEKVHFNPDKPENMNLYISNIKSKHIMMYKDNKWMITPNTELDSIYADKDNLIKTWLEENEIKDPELIEKCCYDFFAQHSILNKIFACGLQDDFYGQKLVLFIESQDEIHFQLQLIDYLKFKLKSWEIPKQFIVLPEFLYTKSGKIDRPNTLTLYLNNLTS
jgi:hypothetical protein